MSAARRHADQEPWHPDHRPDSIDEYCSFCGRDKGINTDHNEGCTFAALRAALTPFIEEEK